MCDVFPHQVRRKQQIGRQAQGGCHVPTSGRKESTLVESELLKCVRGEEADREGENSTHINKPRFSK